MSPVTTRGCLLCSCVDSMFRSEGPAAGNTYVKITENRYWIFVYMYIYTFEISCVQLIGLY